VEGNLLMFRVTLRYVTLRYVTLRYVTLRYVTLRYVTLVRNLYVSYTLLQLFCQQFIGILI
jgi:hypothetical protein